MKPHFPFGNFNNFKADKKNRREEAKSNFQGCRDATKAGVSLPSGQSTLSGLKESISMLVCAGLCWSFS